MRRSFPGACIVSAFPRGHRIERDHEGDLLVLPQARLARLRRAGRPDRPDAPAGRRAAEVDRRGGGRPRAELLPRPARPGSAAARHLHRVQEGRPCRRRAGGLSLHPPRFHHAHGAGVDLRQLRQEAGGPRRPLGIPAGRPRLAARRAGADLARDAEGYVLRRPRAGGVPRILLRAPALPARPARIRIRLRRMAAADAGDGGAGASAPRPSAWGPRFCLFLPSFALVLGAARHMDWLTSRPGVKEFLRGVTSGVVGLMFSISIPLAQVAFMPSGTVDSITVVLGLAAFAALAFWKWRLNVVIVVLGGGALGLLRAFVPALFGGPLS